MKNILTSIIAFLTLAAFGQQMTSSQWDEEAKTNIRLLPKYGHVQKTEAQKQSDQTLIEAALREDSTPRKASDHFIELGFNYLYSDIKTAMYRFNQAWLLDSTNSDIYWGFGAVYLTLGNYAKAEKQYLEGLAINPDNTHLLTDYATCFIAEYYDMKSVDKTGAVVNLEKALTYMLKSYRLDPSDQNTAFKLSVCYWNKDDCDNAWKYYDICKELGGQPITKPYTEDMVKKCKRKK